MVHLGFCSVHKVASEPESRLVWNVLDACLRDEYTSMGRAKFPIDGVRARRSTHGK